jgi:hypothetical protein
VPVLTVAVKVVVFGSAVWAQVATGHPRLVGALGAAAVLSTVLSTAPGGAAGGLSVPAPR